MISSILNLLRPWMMMVVPPSGILISFTILATVPIFSRSLTVGSSMLLSFCATTPTNLSDLYESDTALMLLSRPTVMGITTPGNNTVFLSGRMGNSSGIGCGSDPASSSSFKGMIGMNSISSSDPCRNIFLFIFFS